jgi:hypothetical protein
MPVQHGSPSLDALDGAHLANMQSVADVIRNGSPSLSSSQPTEAIGINSAASSQVTSNVNQCAWKKSKENNRENLEGNYAILGPKPSGS